MKTIFTVLQDIEKLIYKVLMWIILIPKTIIRIIVQPRWAAEYIRVELTTGDSHFDEYVSPVILLLVVALLPSLGYNALPKFGVTLSSPAETALTTDRFLSFQAQVDFISASAEHIYFTDWEVLKKNADGEYALEKSETHPREDGGVAIEKSDNNTIVDRFLYPFSPGEYRVKVSARNVDPESGTGHDIETYQGYLTVTVPVDSTAQVVVSSEGVKALEAEDANFLDRVKDEQTIFLALALMIPPLLFAFVSQAIKIKLEMIGEDSLKESFYVQCYYFSPLSLAVWGTYYAYYYYTADAYWYAEYYAALQILLLPLIWSVLWFIRTEVKRIAWELDPDKVESSEIVSAESPANGKRMSLNKRTVIAFLIVLVCISLLGYGANILLSFDNYMDGLRLTAIRAFPTIAVLLILSFGVAWFKRRRERKDDAKAIGWNFAGLALLTLVFVFAMRQIESSVKLDDLGYATTVPVADSGMVVVTTNASEPFASPSAEATPTSEQQTPTMAAPMTSAPEVTPTPEPPRYYTEEFNFTGELTGWFSFMTYGDPRMIKEDVNQGRLSINIRPLEDKLGWYYLINDAFSYSDVKMDAVVTNQGNNANGVSLICRYSNVGWYEFDISNSGTYKIYAVDNQGIVNQGYNEIANGGSTIIKTGRQTNVYTAVCAGRQLSLFVNQTEVNTIMDDKFQFAEGKIGIAVSSPSKLPVQVDFESLSVSEP